MKNISVSTKIIISTYEDENKPGSFGPGIVYLLNGIKETGSMNQATKDMNMAYSKAWRIIKEAEEMFGFKLLDRYTGSKGSTLTKEAEDVLELYEEIKLEIEKAANNVIEKYLKK